MFKKLFLFLSAFMILSSVLPIFLLAQDAQDISVPAGYKVEKIAETNKVSDPWGMVFDSQGNLMVTSIAFMIFKLDPEGKVEVLGQTRKLNMDPTDIAVAPDGTYYLTMEIADSGSVGIFRYTPPGTFVKLVEARIINSLAFDKQGHLYASVCRENGEPGHIIRYDAAFQEVDEVMSSDSFTPGDFTFDSANNLYYAQPGEWQANNGLVWKIPAGADGIPGADDTPLVFASLLNSPSCLAFDAADNLYVLEEGYYAVDGFSSYIMRDLSRITAAGLMTRGIVTDLADAAGLAYKDNSLYVSEFDRGVISRIDLATLTKIDFTHDYGITTAGFVEFDPDDVLYTQSFRQRKLFRLNVNGQFSQVGQGTGYTQSIASDGTFFYMGSVDQAAGNGNQILKINPIAGTMEVKATQVRGWRSVAFDSYGRLILNCALPRQRFGADIIDLTTGTWTPYVVGIHNKAHCIVFDDRQNLYVVEGIGDGIKKVQLAENYSPARDISIEPLFYDFRGTANPPAIYFFAVNGLEEVFIPRMDTGDLLLGDASGGIPQTFAQGFLCPTNVHIDKYGSLFVSDMNNGLFKIIHERWAVPAVIELNNQLLTDVTNFLNGDILQKEAANMLTSAEAVAGTASSGGIKNSLIKKLQNAAKQLNKGNIIPAINMIKAFINEVEAQRGKAIPIDKADKWAKLAQGMVKALQDVR